MAIRRSFAEDLYIVMPEYDLAVQSASMEIHVNPLVNWIWMGFGLLAIGTAIALLPETVFAFAGATVPTNAATTTLLLLSLVLWPTALIAQSGQSVEPTRRSALYRQLENEIMCTCGCHAPMGSCPMRPNCAHYDQQAARLNEHLMAGKDHDAVLASFVEEFGGQDVLARPLDQGFNRLAWLFPYLVAAAALVGLGVAARRWSRRTPAVAGDAGLVDPALDARLDDELRNLD